MYIFDTLSQVFLNLIGLHVDLLLQMNYKMSPPVWIHSHFAATCSP